VSQPSTNGSTSTKKLKEKIILHFTGKCFIYIIQGISLLHNKSEIFGKLNTSFSTFNRLKALIVALITKG
jgi:hypothetical protein